MISTVDINSAFKLLGVNKERLSLEFVQLESIDGNISLMELFFINSVIQHKKPLNVLELGTFNGRTSANMALNSMESIIHTVDLPFDQDANQTKLSLSTIKGLDERNFTGIKHKVFEEIPEIETRVIQYWHDTADLTSAVFENIKFDFIFIDASHAYEYVLHDSKFALSVLKDSGIILWHDYGGSCGWPGVIKAVNELENNILQNKIFQIGNTSFAIYGI